MNLGVVLGFPARLGPSWADYEAPAFLRSSGRPAVGMKSGRLAWSSASAKNFRAATVLNSPMSFSWGGRWMVRTAARPDRRSSPGPRTCARLVVVADDHHLFEVQLSEPGHLPSYRALPRTATVCGKPLSTQRRASGTPSTRMTCPVIRFASRGQVVEQPMLVWEPRRKLPPRLRPVVDGPRGVAPRRPEPPRS